MAEQDELERAQASLAKRLAERGLKVTRQRSVVADAFFRQKGHVTVDELFAQLRGQHRGTSVATVYRTMKLLAQCGLATQRQFGDGPIRYEPSIGREQHDHLICERCGTIIEFEDDVIEVRRQVVARRHGFTITRHALELYGVCAQCSGAAHAAG